MRVLFPLHGFVAWNGGLDLVRTMSSALEAVALERNIEVHYAIPVPTRSQRWLAAAVRRWHLFRSGDATGRGASTEAVLAQAIDQITQGRSGILCDATAGGILATADKIDADIVFPTMLPLGPASRRRVGYIFDFQHRHLPQYFSPRIRRNRDRRFRALARDVNAIVVNASTVARDAQRFLRMPPERILALPFSPYALPWWFDADPQATREAYGIGPRFLMVSNHFWVHKDHETALRAFALVRRAPGQDDLELVLTGDPVDHRDPAHYGRLVGLASSLGVAQQVHFLGLVPKRHQLALLRASAALLQPTRFEGGPGGGSVAEAIGLGVPAVVSDIPVNLEIEVGRVAFFRMGDPDDLARTTIETLSSVRDRPTPEASIAAGQRNLVRLGHAIADSLTRLVESRRGA